jgi:hypothetical protein
VTGGYGVTINGQTIENTLPGVSLQAGNNITISGLTISAIVAGSTVYAGEGMSMYGMTISNGYARVYADTLEPTGFLDRTAILSFGNSNRTVGITGTHSIYLKGIKHTLTTNSIAISNDDGMHFVYYDSGASLTETQVFPGMSVALLAFAYWNKTDQTGILADERHGINMDHETHRFLHSTIGTRYESGLAGTFGGASFGTDSGVIWDEDIRFAISGQSLCDVLYRNNATTYSWIAGSCVYYHGLSTTLAYNEGISLAPVDASKFVASWIFATNSVTNPIVSIIGQRQDTTLAQARQNNTYESLSLGDLPFKEMKLLYRVLSRGNKTYVETQDLRSVSNVPAGTYVATAHSTLTGLDYNSSNHTGFQAEITGGWGVTVNGSTIENTLPGVSMKAGVGINVNGLTITNTLGFVGTGGVSVSLSGNTYTIYGLSSALNTNLVSEGTSNFYYRGDRFVGMGGASVSVSGVTLTVYAGNTFYAGTGINVAGLTITNSQPGTSMKAGFGIDISGVTITNSLPGASLKAGVGINISGLTITNTLGFVGTGGVSVSLSGNTYTIFGLSSALNTNLVSEGTSNFYYRGDRLRGTGGASISVNGVTITVYAGQTFYAGTGIDVTGLTITNSQPGISLKAGYGIDISGVTVTNSLPGASLKAGVGINISGLTITNTLGFVGTGGVSVSLTGNTYTIYGLSSALNTNLVSEGTSNFYYRGDRFVGTGGASVSVSGLTLTIYSSTAGSGSLSAGASGQIQIANGTSFAGLSAFTIESGAAEDNVLVGLGASGRSVTLTLSNTGGDQYLGIQEAYPYNIGSGSNLYVNAGDGSNIGAGDGGILTLAAGAVGSSGNGGNVNIVSGDGSAVGKHGGDISLKVGNGSDGATLGGVAIHGRVGSLYSPTAGSILLDTVSGERYYFGCSENGKWGEFSFLPLTVARKYTFPDYTGTVALTGTTELTYYTLGSSLVELAGSGINVTGRTITNTLPGVSMKAGVGINVTGLTITNTLGFVGTGGVSVSLSGNTYTIFGLSSAINSDLVSEGSSNFYHRVNRFVGTGGVSVSGTGLTLTIYGLSSALNTNLVSEGTSNFYYRGDRFVGTGGASISVNGVTVTVYGTSVKTSDLALITVGNTFTGNQYVLGNIVGASSVQANNLILGGVSVAASAAELGVVVGANTTVKSLQCMARCRAYLNNAQDNLVDSTETLVLLDAENYDSNNNFTGSLYTAPVNGYYSLKGSVGYKNVVADKRYFAEIMIGGTVRSYSIHSFAVTGNHTVQVATDYYIEAGTTVGLYAQAIPGVNTVDLIPGIATTYLSIHLLSAA